MTGVVALDAVAGRAAVARIRTVTVSADAAAVGESSAGLQEGDTMTLKTALYALLVPSGNDAAVAIAEIGGRVLCGGAGHRLGRFRCEAAFVERR